MRGFRRRDILSEKGERSRYGHRGGEDEIDKEPERYRQRYTKRDIGSTSQTELYRKRRDAHSHRDTWSDKQTEREGERGTGNDRWSFDNVKDLLIDGLIRRSTKAEHVLPLQISDYCFHQDQCNALPNPPPHSVLCTLSSLLMSNERIVLARLNDNIFSSNSLLNRHQSEPTEHHFTETLQCVPLFNKLVSAIRV